MNTCGTCGNWIPNGGYFCIGYCTKEKFSYRKINQTCDKYVYFNELFDSFKESIYDLKNGTPVCKFTLKV